MEQAPAPHQQYPMLSFSIAYAKSSAVGPRVGRLTRVGQKAIKTPHYVATTSRGVVPHISHDTLQKHTAVSSIYLALEDCMDSLHAALACADSVLTVSF